MTSLHIILTKKTLQSRVILYRICRNFMTSLFTRNKQESKEDMEDLKSNPYYAKYAGKIDSMAKSKPEEFQSNLKELEEGKKKEAEEKRKSYEEALEKQKEQSSQRKAKGLDGIVKLDLLREKSAEEITEIWKEYHKDKPCVFAVIPSEEYQQLYQRSVEFSTFLYPLPRGQGYEFMMQQFDGHDCHFTPLVMYQRHQENAPPCFTMTHYTELQDDKNIVLMNSEINKDIISVHEAQLLALQLKMYYGLNSGLKFNLVRMFKNVPQSFNHMDLVKEFEKYKQDFKAAKDGTWV